MSQVSPADAPAPASFAGSRVNRPALAAAIAVGQVIGVLPTCFIIGGPQLALRAVGALVALTLVVELIASFKPQPTMSTTRPRARHYVFAAAAASFHGLIVGYMWLALYWMIAGGIWLLRAVIGWPAVTDVLAAATTPSIVLAATTAATSIAQAHRELTEQLCPNRAGIDTVFETGPLSTRAISAFTAAVLGAGALLIAAAIAQYQMSGWLASAALFTIMMTSVPLATLSATEVRPAVRDVIEKIKGALEGMGCEVLPAPRTGDAAVDPLLADLSLYARAPGRRYALAIDVKASPAGEPLDWSAGSSLTLKVSALTSIENRDTDGDRIEAITPVLVLLAPADESLREFARDHRVMLFELTETASEKGRGAAEMSLTTVVPELIRTLSEQLVHAR